jgi:hypothetical protein
MTPLLLLAVLLLVPASQASVQWQTRTAQKTSSPPLDVASTADGKRTFVLSEGGLITIYGADGSIIDTMKVDPATDRISTDGGGSQLFLTSRAKGTVSQISLDYQFDLDYTGSPFQGKAEAPVVMAVFSDFQ